MRRLGLTPRLALLSAAITLGTAVVAGVVGVGLIQQATQAQAQRQLTRLAVAAAAESDAGTPARSRPTLRALRVGSGNVDPSGQISSNSALVRHALSPAEGRQVLSGQSVGGRRRVNGQSVLVAARPTRSGGVVLLQRRSDAVSLGDAAIRRLLLALLVAAVVAGLAGGIVAWRLSRPLRRTAAAAHAIAAGRRDVVLTPQGPAEAAEVAHALNALVDGLSRSEGRQREFLLSVSHDLRTPLTAIRGYAESLADGVVTGPDAARAGTVMLGEAKRLDRMVADLLDLARLDADQLRLEFGEVDLAALVDQAGFVWSARCAADGVRFSIIRPPGAVAAGTDPGRVRQMLDGLLENALRVTPAGRPIVVETRSEADPAGHWAVVEVRDGGPGLTDDDLRVAFQHGALFERYRGVRRVGTGLGLTIVQRLAGRLGGSVEAGHAAEGGARFTVRLPGWFVE